MKTIIIVLLAVVLASCASTPLTYTPTSPGTLSSSHHRLESFANLQYLSCDAIRYFPGRDICRDHKDDIENDLPHHQHCKAGIYYKPDPLKRQTAIESYLYALLSNNVYRDPLSKPIFLIKGYENPIRYDSSSGLGIEEYRLFNRKNQLKKIVVVYEGTNFTSRKDWKANLTVSENAPLQYRQAYRHMQSVQTLAHQHGAKVIVTGHSLGGAIALYISYHFEGVDAYAFNTSPRIFSEIHGANHNRRIIVAENGEILAWVRKLWKQISLQNPVHYNFQKYSNPLTKSLNEHSIYNIARGLLLYAAGAGDPHAEAIFTNNMLQAGYQKAFDQRPQYAVYKQRDIAACEAINANARKADYPYLAHHLLKSEPVYATGVDDRI